MTTRSSIANRFTSRKPRTIRQTPALEQLECRELLSNVVTPFDSQHAVGDVRGTESVIGSAMQDRMSRPTGFIKSAEAIDGNTIRVDFDKKLSRNVAARLDFEIAGLDITDVETARNRRSAVLTTAPQDSSVYVVQASVVKGSAGQSHVVREATASFLGKSAPRVVDVKVVNDTTVLITYDRPMGSSAINPANYTLSSETGEPIAVAGAQFVGQGSQIASMVEVRTTPQTYTNYSFNISNVADSTGQQVFFEGRKILTGNPKGAVISVAATSPTRVVVAFNEPMADNALAPQHYIIKDPTGKPLLVTDVEFDGPLTMTFVLTTAAQQNVNYTLTVANITDLQNDGLDKNTGTFQGIASPSLVKAIPTDSTHIVLTFGGPVGDSALAPSTYKIDKLDAQGNVIGSLPVIAATFLGDRRTVVELTTPAQEDARYRISTTPALTDVAGSPLPVSQQELQGIGDRPTLVGATSNGPNTLLLTFSEPMSDDALSPSAYLIKAPDGTPLRVLGVEFVGTERRMVQLTTENQANVAYTVVSINATDLDGSSALVPTSPAINTFPGKGTQSEAPEIAGPPRVVGAGSLSNTELLVVFSEPMASSATNVTNYIITQATQNPEAGVLHVTAAEFYLGNPSVVKLTTLSQNELSYKVTVINATDRAGNALAPEVTNGGGTTDPTSSTFPGTPPNAATQRDSDGDGLLDSEEMRGWTVTARLGNGTVVERGVTSDTTLVDTDADGIADHVELSVRSDPRDADTDDDGLPDLVEVRDNVGDPTKQDSDDDGLTDLAEKIGWTINITLGDGSVVTQQVTSNPFLADTDLDGLVDRIEKIVQVDPRNPDSDSDGATDGQEVNAGKNPTKDNPGDKTAAADPKELPRVTGAASQSNTSVLVAFSKPMDDSALNPGNYIIVQTNVNPEPGVLLLADGPDDTDTNPDIVWANAEHTAVLLTTFPQNELTYTVTVVNVRDTSGNALAPPVPVAGGLINISSINFPGTPASGDQVDTDDDGLTDSVEMRGWFVTVQNVDGTTTTRGITSDPLNPDTDGDGLNDAQEANLRFDPRAIDSDDDQLNDYAEFNEIYSNGLSQDTDGDTLDDFLEFAFFKTSPVFADTDGDQLRDDYEIVGNRNPRVSDLPRPEITVGEVQLQLDVRFTETNERETRDLETKTARTTLTRSESEKFTRSDTINAEAHLDVGTKDDQAKNFSDTGNIYIRAGFSVGYTFNQTSESEQASQEELETTRSTDKEVTRGSAVERHVEGASMKVPIDLRNLSNLAFRVKNLQVTAFIQDPQDPGKLAPVATLLPDSEPDDGFTLGPLVAQKGPFIFSNTSIIPSLVESLMANSSGLIFRISNYDIIDENDRNFAFTSQEIVERTSRLVIDYGGASSLRALVSGEPFDELKPGDETEIYRVATSAGQVIDTNGDGTIDDSDRQATFDLAGKEVGITIFEALSAVGLTQYDEATTPTSSLTEAQILGSYSTYIAPAEVIGGISYPEREKIFRIRGISNDTINQKFWEIVTAQGIDQETNLRDLILKTNSPVSLNFVQDLDKDRLSADVEFFLRTSDSPMPFAAEIPGATDTTTDTVTYSTDPGFLEGTIVRVTEDTGLDPDTGLPSLTAGTNYSVHNLGNGTYSLYDSIGTIDLRGPVTAGIFPAAKPLSTNTTDMFVSYAAIPTATDFTTAESVTFSPDPAFATATVIQVTQTGGGLTAGTKYFIRNLGGGSYSFYDTGANASAGGGSTAGRVNLSGPITAGIFRASDRHFPTATLVQVTETGAGLTAGVNYFIRNLGGASFSFYDTVEHATAGSANTTGRIPILSNVTAGIFSPTAKGRDTDGDGLDDRFESLIGWTVNTPQRTYRVHSSPNRGDSNFDGPKPAVDSNANGIEDRLEYDSSDLFAAPAGWIDQSLDTNGDGVPDTAPDGLRSRFEIYQLRTQNNTPDYVLDPKRKDTDIDGINDATEILGFFIKPITGGAPFLVRTNAVNPFTDSDTFSDGLERTLGLDPTNGADTDEDGDGLPDLVETLGWTVYSFKVSTTPFEEGEYTPGFDRTVTPDSTDKDADTVRFKLANDPNVPRFTLVHVTGGGLEPDSPYYLGRLDAQPDPTSVFYALYYTASDAAAGTSRGAFDLLSNVTAIQLAAEYKHVVPLATDLVDDVVKFDENTDPVASTVTLVQVTGGGLTPNTNYFLGRRDDQPEPNVVRYSFYLSTADAAKGTASGALNLASPITDVRLPAESHKASRTDSDDSDGDGITDFEEFFLGTDPSSADSDRDGIQDRIESLGYSLGHDVGGKNLGIIKTSPLDADSDNDKRSDGAEAELIDVQANRWIVRNKGDISAYRAFSNPLEADADSDGLVDGDEFNLDPEDNTRHTDPNKSDTDADGPSDTDELKLGTDPLEFTLDESIRITVVAEYIVFSADGDNDGPGEVTTKLQVRLPSSTATAGLSPNLTDVLNVFNHPVDDQGINGGYGDWYYFSRDTYNLPLNQRAYTFRLGKGQRFAVEGIVRESDFSNSSYYEFKLGGLDGIRAFSKPLPLDGNPEIPQSETDWTRTVFSYDEIAQKTEILSYYFQFDSNEFPLTRFGDDSDQLAGELAFYIIVG